MKRISLKEEKYELERMIKILDAEIKAAPKGRLRTNYKRKTPQYYICDEGAGTSGMTGRYLGRKDEELIRALAQKDYDKRLLKEAESRLNMLEYEQQEDGHLKLTCFLHLKPQGLRLMQEALK